MLVEFWLQTPMMMHSEKGTKTWFSRWVTKDVAWSWTLKYASEIKSLSPFFMTIYFFYRDAFLRIQNNKFGGWEPYAAASNILMLTYNSNLSYEHIKIGCASLVMLTRLHGSTFCHQNDLQWVCRCYLWWPTISWIWNSISSTHDNLGSFKNELCSLSDKLLGINK